MLTIDQIRGALLSKSHVPQAFEAAPSWASVAMIFAGKGDELELCFIKRAEREGDPWSGQVAFPGGRAGPGDAGPLDVAERETWEEIGLRLEKSHRVAPLPELPVRRGDVDMHLTLSPFVYHLGGSRFPVKPNHEVAEVFWVPLSHLFDAGNTTSLDFVRNGESFTFPGVAFGGRIVWGLTLRVLGIFAEQLDRELPSLSASEIHNPSR